MLTVCQCWAFKLSACVDLGSFRVDDGAVKVDGDCKAYVLDSPVKEH